MGYYSENETHRQSESVDNLRTRTIYSDLRMLKMLTYDKCVTGIGAVLKQDRHPMAYYRENETHRPSESVDNLRT
ncbi:hypothetical protein ZOSMA_1042G00010 [Zostera marina]|uniref:Uncharacterized protein n=1 Tax=Zostera marina TaxID=29655 RepID=A0A0K9Q537_ZOSMR|nr:hypothetical protein ZOSMA_1042G00010 [Zostera marina]